MLNVKASAQDSALELALAYAESGYSPVPLLRHNKVPPKELGGWQKFKERYKQTYTFVEDITKIDLTKDVIALWFFKERSDQTAGPFIEIGNKQITYNHNTFFLTKHRRLIIKETKRKYIRRPVLQLDMTAKQFEDIIGNLK